MLQLLIVPGQIYCYWLSSNFAITSFFLTKSYESDHFWRKYFFRSMTIPYSFPRLKFKLVPLLDFPQLIILTEVPKEMWKKGL